MTDDVLYEIRLASDMRPADGFACGVDAVVRAASRAAATSLLRAADVGGFSSRDVRRVHGAADEERLGLPVVAPGEVWVRTNAVPGEWTVRR